MDGIKTLGPLKSFVFVMQSICGAILKKRINKANKTQVENVQLGNRVQKMLNSSYEPNPEISNLTTFSETRQPDFGARSIFFAI